MRYFTLASTITISLVLLLIGETKAAPINPTNTLKIATFNIRTKANNESTLRKEELPWDIRKEPLIQSIISAKPDIIGFQEPRQEQVDNLTDGLTPLWSCTSQLIWEGGDCLATCWNTETTDLIQREHYFHSETPEELGSISWDATWPMGTLTTAFRLKSTNEIFWTINTHFDPNSQFAKNKSAELILDRERSIITGEDSLTPSHSMIFLFGDLNDNEISESYSILTGNRYSYIDPFNTIVEGINPTSKPKSENENESKKESRFRDLRKEIGSDKITPTFEDLTIGNKKRKSPKIIDFIMLVDNNALENQDWKVEDVRIVDNGFIYDEMEYMVSDHRMMMVELSN